MLVMAGLNQELGLPFSVHSEFSDYTNKLFGVSCNSKK